MNRESLNIFFVSVAILLNIGVVVAGHEPLTLTTIPNTDIYGLIFENLSLPESWKVAHSLNKAFSTKNTDKQVLGNHVKEQAFKDGKEDAIDDIHSGKRILNIENRRKPIKWYERYYLDNYKKSYNDSFYTPALFIRYFNTCNLLEEKIDKSIENIKFGKTKIISHNFQQKRVYFGTKQEDGTISFPKQNSVLVWKVIDIDPELLINQFASAPEKPKKIVVSTESLVACWNRLNQVTDEQLQNLNQDIILLMNIMVNESGFSTLHGACFSNHFVTLKFLLKNGDEPFVNSRNNEGLTPLHIACYRGNLEAAKLFVAYKANVNSKNNQCVPPLHYASNKGYVAIAQLLLENEAKVNSRDEIGLTPLHYACSGGHVEVAKLLLEHGADIKSTGGGSILRDTPWDFASSEMRKQIPELYPGNKVMLSNMLIPYGIIGGITVMVTSLLFLLMHKLGIIKITFNKKQKTQQ